MHEVLSKDDILDFSITLLQLTLKGLFGKSSERLDSNQQPFAPKANTPPLSYVPDGLQHGSSPNSLNRMVLQGHTPLCL